eukprot:3197276-Amphidinium_carterae.1
MILGPGSSLYRPCLNTIGFVIQFDCSPPSATKPQCGHSAKESTVTLSWNYRDFSLVRSKNANHIQQDGNLAAIVAPGLSLNCT